MNMKSTILILFICMVLVLPVAAVCQICNLNWTYPIEPDYTPYNYSQQGIEVENIMVSVSEIELVPGSPPTIEEVTGSVEFIIRAGGAVMSREIYLVNQIDEHQDWQLIPVWPYGKSDPFRLIPGNFTALMPDGNGGHAEWRNFSIVVGDEKRVVFLGHAISMHHRETPTVEPTPTPTPDPDTCYPVEFETVFGGHTCGSQEVTYILNNQNREVKTVYIYATENYLTSNCQRGTVGCCIDTETTRVLPTSSWAAYPGQSEYTVQIGRMDGHVSYQFRTETMCPR